MTGTEVGVDHFWTYVRRWPQDAEVPSAFAGPFPLKDEDGELGAHSIAWRISTFAFLSAFSSRPDPMSPYAGANNIDTAVGVAGIVIDDMTVRSPLGREVEYVTLLGTASPETQASFTLPNGALMGIFVNNTVGTDELASILYRPGYGFYFGVNISIFPGSGGGSGAIIPTNPSGTLTEQTSAVFTVFGKRVRLYAATSDAAMWTGSASITVAGDGYWPYDNESGPIYDTSTGATLISPIPVVMD